MYTAVIVEPRVHNALPFVLKNFDENLPDEWSILVIHGTENNIFIKDNDDIDEVFNKTETVNYIELKKMFTKASKLEEIQAIAIKLSVPIVSGSTKEGRPKNRVKNDIINDINKLFSMMII